MGKAKKKNGVKRVKRTPKEKVEKAPAEVGETEVSGRKPVLAPYVEKGFAIFAKYKGSEYEAKVLADGFIEYEGEHYATPSAAAKAIIGNNEDGKPLQVDGWHFWRFENDKDERVPLGDLRPDSAVRRRSDKKAA